MPYPRGFLSTASTSKPRNSATIGHRKPAATRPSTTGMRPGRTGFLRAMEAPNGHGKPQRQMALSRRGHELADQAGERSSVQRVLSERMILSEAIDAAVAIIGGYPNGGANAGDSYIGALASTLMGHPRQVGAALRRLSAPAGTAFARRGGDVPLPADAGGCNCVVRERQRAAAQSWPTASAASPSR